jgi:polyhydroxyalkanoate synthase
MDRNDKNRTSPLQEVSKRQRSGNAATKGGADKKLSLVSAVQEDAPTSSSRAKLKRPTGQKPRADSPATSIHEVMDRTAQSEISRFTHGLSPAALMGAWFDWATHISVAPGKQLQLVEKAVDKIRRQARFAGHCADTPGEAKPCIDPLPQDSRFSDDAWKNMPFNMIYQGFLLQQQWWHNAVTDVPGVTAQHERELQFLTRQMLDMYSPSNFLPTNPEILRKTREEAGQNLIRGMQYLLEDARNAMTGESPKGVEEFQPGKKVALTPGKVIYRNRLIELIQYTPTTETTRPEPIMIVPAWIMKYYILDLSQTNSLVRYLVAQGYTVFMISWKNPDEDDRDLTMDDYRQLGVMSALEAVQTIVPNQKVHAMGYCLGGTLLAIAAAAIARGEDDPFATLTLLASQVDFSEAGELQLFINESQLAFLDSVMWKQGYLDTTQMGGAFQMLRSNDLVWSRAVREYLMGEREPMFDLMAWNADGTRMPYAMHSEYLHKLYLNNDLTEGRFEVDERPVAITDIRAPVFAVGTVKDHVAPWHSVFKIHAFSDTDVTFVLTSGGHNAGIVSEPGHQHRSFQIHSKRAMDRYVDPETWAAETEIQDGSWWEAWVAWLDAHSGKPTSPPEMGNIDSGYRVLADAPGTYVMQK